VKIRPLLNPEGKVIGLTLVWETPKDLADLLRGATAGFSAWGDRPKWGEALLDFLRKEKGE